MKLNENKKSQSLKTKNKPEQPNYKTNWLHSDSENKGMIEYSILIVHNQWDVF